MNSFHPLHWIMLLWEHGLIGEIWSPLEAAFTLTSKVIRLSQCMMAIKITAIMMTTMAIMMTPMMAREMTVIMIRDAPVPHQCITVSTISSSWNTQDAHIMTIRMIMINDDKGIDDMVCYRKWQQWHCPKMTLPTIILSICHSQHDFNLLRHARCIRMLMVASMMTTAMVILLLTCHFGWWYICGKSIDCDVDRWWSSVKI